MKSFQNIASVLLILNSLSLFSCGQKPVYFPDLPVSEVTPYFSEASQTQAIDTAFYEVKDANGHLLGTVLFSSPYSDHIKGYNGRTPLLIALDAEGRISKVVLLVNHETPRFAQHVEDNGLYEVWNGLTPAEALDKNVDAISGATFTSNRVKNSLITRLKVYERQLKKDRTEQKNFWQRLFSK